MPEILRTLIPYLVGGMLLLALVLFLGALWYFRRGKREPYWRLRRAASLHGWEMFLVSLTIGFVATALCLFSGFAQMIMGGNSPSSAPTAAVAVATTAALPTVPTLPSDTPVAVTATPEPPVADSTGVRNPSATAPVTPFVEPNATPSPSPVPSVSPTGTPVAVSPSPSASSTATALVVRPLVSSVTPLPEASLRITAVDSAVTDDLRPVHSRTTLEAGVERIYFWVAYSAMTDGAAWERLLFHDGTPVQGGAYLWSGGQEGEELYFFGDAAGFDRGEYEIRLSLGGETVAVLPVTVE